MFLQIISAGLIKKGNQNLLIALFWYRNFIIDNTNLPLQKQQVYLVLEF